MQDVNVGIGASKLSMLTNKVELLNPSTQVLKHQQRKNIMFLEAFFSTVASKVFTEIFKRAVDRIVEITIQKHHLAAVQSLANKHFIKKAPAEFGGFSFELVFASDGNTYYERHIDSGGSFYPGKASSVSEGIRRQSPNSLFFTVIKGRTPGLK